MNKESVTFSVKKINQPQNTINKRFSSIKNDYELANNDHINFWNMQANQLHWQPWTETLEWKRPYSKWFIDGKLIASENCGYSLPKHCQKLAIIWEGENGTNTTLTYQELHQKVCQLANALTNECNIHSGDRITIYMPLIPEAIIAMLACSRIGAIHSVVFGGFSAPSLAERINDSQSTCIITADTANRRGKTIQLRNIVEHALNTGCPSITSIITLNKSSKSGTSIPEHDFNALINKQNTTFTPKQMDSEDPLFILYTSGTTGKPKGIVHTTGGYLTHAKYSTKLVFDLEPSDFLVHSRCRLDYRSHLFSLRTTRKCSDHILI